MATGKWEKDFRCNAVTTSVASTELLKSDDPFTLPMSFCLPVSRYAMHYWNPTTMFGLCFASFLGMLIIGALTLPLDAIDNMPPGLEANLWHAFMVAFMISAFSTVIVPMVYWKQIVKMFIGQRGRDLCRLAEKSGSEITYAFVTDPEEFNPNKVPEDSVMILVDPIQKRLVMEGTTARYQIRNEDIQHTKPFQLNIYRGTKISYSLADRQNIELLVVEVSLIDIVVQQFKFLAFLRRFNNKPLFDNLKSAGVEQETGEQETGTGPVIDN